MNSLEMSLKFLDAYDSASKTLETILKLLVSFHPDTCSHLSHVHATNTKY